MFPYYIFPFKYSWNLLKNKNKNKNKYPRKRKPTQKDFLEWTQKCVEQRKRRLRLENTLNKMSMEGKMVQNPLFEQKTQ